MLNVLIIFARSFLEFGKSTEIEDSNLNFVTQLSEKSAVIWRKKVKQNINV